METDKVLESVVRLCAVRLHADIEVSSALAKERGLSETTISEFGLGLFPQDLRELREADIPLDALRRVGVIRNATSSVFQTWDLVLPIRDAFGRAVALAGRTRLPAAEREARRIPKYINTPYAKSRHLFGLHLVKRAILESGTAYVAEGYFDAMLARQAGMGRVVACCGTAFSARHAVLLARYARRAILLFDNDDAGQEGARKAAARRDCPELSVSTMRIVPEGFKDLGELIASRPSCGLASVLDELDGYARI